MKIQLVFAMVLPIGIVIVLFIFVSLSSLSTTAIPVKDSSNTVQTRLTIQI